jgi:hypothetical protein
MSEEVEKQETKQWKTVASFPTFEEADLERKKLLDANEQVKVRRQAGEVFRVKVWNPPVKKQTSKKSKGKKKNANEKVRN